MTILSIIALGLLTLSGLLLDAHRRNWHAADSSGDLDERGHRAARAMYLRRMQASGVVGVIAVLLLVRPLVPREPLWFVTYLLVLVLLCGWMLLLAAIDAFAASLKLRESRNQTKQSRKKLEAEHRAAREKQQTE